MKTQLLEDIGENHSVPIIPPKNVAPAPANGTPPPAAAPSQEADKWRAGPWRQRASAPLGEGAAPAYAAPEPSDPPIHTLDPDPLAECWAIANPDIEPAWYERWGRRAAAWSAALAALVLVAGGAAWMYKETKTDQALAVASAALDAPVPGYVTRAPLRTVEPIDVPASELALDTPGFEAEVPDFSPTPVAAKPARSRVRAVAKAPRRVAAPPPDPAAVRESKMAETLRQCRAAGYHAEQCIKRGCVATPFGIACKG
ncbi:hypothetical protein ACFSQU_02495 [Massilia sp. GCM10020059]|uniref:Uncharacterized protein n=1 Tax=Massilia agrisoli TaxID=2892444 RepID=A0ABS8IMK4_9BURK|nr:hypothetical protein [Massilia agrisoli]MCC6069785.1 hypothetical protein [Massilia agrisoli]